MDEARKERHNERMRRKKTIVDAAISQAVEERGVVIALSGNGKGKTSSAFGMVFRALGYGQRIGIVQFIKGTRATGEVVSLQKLVPPAQFEYYAMASGFTWESQNWAADQQAAQRAWSHAGRMLADDTLQLVLFDELTYMFKYKFLDVNMVAEAIQRRPTHQSVVITGRGLPSELDAVADTVSEIADCKHAFRAGVKAQAGIDF